MASAQSVATEKAQTVCHIQNGFSTTLIVLWSSLRLGRTLLRLSVLLAFGLRC